MWWLTFKYRRGTKYYAVFWHDKYDTTTTARISEWEYEQD